MAKTGRNALCPCGSGKKYKKCCLDSDRQAESEGIRVRSQELERDLDVVRSLQRTDWQRTEDSKGRPEYRSPWMAFGELDDAGFGAVDWPLDPTLKHLNDHIEDGRRHTELGSWEEAIHVWWRVWEEIRTRIPDHALDIDGLERELGIDWQLTDFVYKLVWGLREAGRANQEHHERRIRFCRDLGERFSESDPFFDLNMCRAVAESLFALGRVEEGEREYQMLVDARPDDAQVYVYWGDMYGLHRISDAVPEDLDRAMKLYRMGIEQTTGDHGELRRRLFDAQERRAGGQRPPRRYLDDGDIAQLIVVGGQVGDDLWERIVRRGSEVVPLLNALLVDALWIEQDARISGGVEEDDALWGLVHAAYLAARIGDSSSIVPLLDMADICADEDWLHSGLPWFPTRFGVAGGEPFLRFCLDRNRDVHVRAGIAEGLVWAAGLYPDLRQPVASAFANELVSDKNDDSGFTAWLMMAAIRGDIEALHEAIRVAEARGAWDPGFFGALDECLRLPRDWYLDLPPEHEDDVAYRAGLPGMGG